MPAYVFRFTANHGQELIAEAPIMVYNPDRFNDLIQASWPEIVNGPFEAMVRYVIDAAIQAAKGEGTLSTLKSPMAFGGDITFQIMESPEDGVEGAELFPRHAPGHDEAIQN